MFLERKFNKKRGFIGYNPKEVKSKMDEIQTRYQEEKEQLEQQIIDEKEKNKRLKEKLAEIKQKTLRPELDKVWTK